MHHRREALQTSSQPCISAAVEPSPEKEGVVDTLMTKLVTIAIVAETTVPRGDGEPSPEKEWLIDTAMTEQQVQELAPKATVAETTIPKADNEPSQVRYKELQRSCVSRQSRII
ncbi:hypothetical protein MTO96_035680 [Rhipicephalus appendiculatus]